MVNSQLIKEKYYLILFIIFIFVGINIYKDFGLSIDDEYYRINGVFYKDFIIKYVNLLLNLNFSELELLKNEIDGSSLRNHPALFETLIAFTSDLFQINEIEKIYELSHLVNYIIYLLSLIFIFKLLNTRYNSKTISIVAVILIFLTPRFFAESFYNSRDIFFFSLFVFNIYAIQNVISNNRTRNIIIYSFTAALLINAKILGIVPFLIFMIMYIINLFEKNKNISTNIKKIAIILVSTFVFIVILWPYLWFDPIDNFIKAYLDIIDNHNRLSVITFFNGEYLSSISTPWYYRIIWFYITTPIIVCILFTIGLSYVIKNFVKNIVNLEEKKTRIWTNNSEFYDFYLLLVLICICFLVIKFNISQFNGWRHLYFLYCAVIYFSVYGYNTIIKNKKNYFKYFINFIIFLNISYNLTWIYKNHPYQNNYFNLVSFKYATSKFDLDYWGLSNYQSLKFILNNDNRSNINVSTISFSDLKVSVLKLNSSERKRINIVYDPKESDYLINSYMPKLKKNFIISSDTFTRLHDIKVNNTSINTIYKKN